MRAGHALRAEGAGAQASGHDADLARRRELRRRDPRGQRPGAPLGRDPPRLGLDQGRRISQHQHRPHRRHGRRDVRRLAADGRAGRSRWSPTASRSTRWNCRSTRCSSTTPRRGGAAVAVADWPTKRAWVDWAFDRFIGRGYAVSSGYTLVRDPARVHFRYRDMLWEGSDLVALGVASFGHLSGVHYQNATALGRLPRRRSRRAGCRSTAGCGPRRRELLVRETRARAQAGPARHAAARRESMASIPSRNGGTSGGSWPPRAGWRSRSRNRCSAGGPAPHRCPAAPRFSSPRTGSKRLPADRRTRQSRRTFLGFFRGRNGGRPPEGLAEVRPAGFPLSGAVRDFRRPAVRGKRFFVHKSAATLAASGPLAGDGPAAKPEPLVCPSSKAVRGTAASDGGRHSWRRGRRRACPRQPDRRPDCDPDAESLVRRAGADAEVIGWTMVTLVSEYWRDRLAAVPAGRRLLLLPDCPTVAGRRWDGWRAPRVRPHLWDRHHLVGRPGRGLGGGIHVAGGVGDRCPAHRPV